MTVDMEDLAPVTVLERPSSAWFRLDLGYSPRFSQSELRRGLGGNVRANLLVACIGEFTELQYHTTVIAHCVQIRIFGHYKSVNPIDLTFAGPIDSTHRFPSGATLLIQRISSGDYENDSWNIFVSLFPPP